MNAGNSSSGWMKNRGTLNSSDYVVTIRASTYYDEALEPLP